MVIWENEGAIQAKMWNMHFVRDRADLCAAVDVVGNGMIGLQYGGENAKTSSGYRLCSWNWARDELWYFMCEGTLVWLKTRGYEGRWITFPTRPTISDPLLISSLPSLTEEEERLSYPLKDWRRITEATGPMLPVVRSQAESVAMRHSTARTAVPEADELTEDQMLAIACGPHLDQLSPTALQRLKTRMAENMRHIISDPNKIAGAPYNPIHGRVHDVVEFGPSHYLVIWENEGAIQAKMWNMHFVRDRADLCAAVDVVGNGMIGLQYGGEDAKSSSGYRLCAWNWARDELWHFMCEGTVVWLRTYGHKGRWITFPTRPTISDPLLISSLPSLTEKDWRRLTPCHRSALNVCSEHNLYFLNT